jgi:hypothetical protein
MDCCPLPAFPVSLIAQAGARLSAEQAFALWDQAKRATGDPFIAQHVIGVLPFGTYRIADYLLLTGATPRDSLQKFVRSFPLVNNVFEMHLATWRGGAHLQLHSPYAPDGPSHFYVEFIFSMILARLRLPPGWTGVRRRFVSPGPSTIEGRLTIRCLVVLCASMARRIA